MIFMTHSLVKVTVKIISISSKDSFTQAGPPLGTGWNTARQRHVPQIASSIKPSNIFHSTISINFFLSGFFKPNTQRAYRSRSTGGLAPTLLTAFLGSVGGSAAAPPLGKGTASPFAAAGSFNPFSTADSILEGTFN